MASVNKYLLFSVEGAQRFLDLISRTLPDYYKKQTGKTFIGNNQDRNTKYWKLIVGGFLSDNNGLSGKPLLTDASLLYDIDRYVRTADKETKPLKIYLPSIKGIFENLFSEDFRRPEDFGIIEAIPVSRGRRKKETPPQLPMVDHKSEEFKDGRVADLINSQWSVYCWEEYPASPLESGKLPYSDIIYGIECNVLHFDENYTTLYVKTQHNIDAYQGNYFITATRWLLEAGPLTISNKGRNLRILADIGDRGSLPEMMSGVFYNSRQDSRLVCGSVLLVRRNGSEILTKERLEKGETLGFQSHKTNLPRVIRHFFRHRGQNFIQLPKSGYSLHELESILKRLGRDGKSVRYTDYEYDAFISVPLTSPGTEDVYVANRDIARKLKHVLVDKFKVSYERLYLACESFESLQKYNFKNSSDLFEETRKNLINSRYYILLYPYLYDNTRISSAVTELGMAVGMGKMAVLFCSKEVHGKLPRNIIESKWVKFYALTPDNAQSLDEQLESLVESNKSQMFRLMLNNLE